MMRTFEPLLNSRDKVEVPEPGGECPTPLPFEQDTFDKPVFNLKSHIAFLRSVQKSFKDGFELEFDSLREGEIGMRRDAKFTISASLSVNTKKNRYSTVLPNEISRVKLLGIPDEPGTDYINANFVYGQLFGIDQTYIATQAPIDNTFDDFWRMVWEQKSPVILILANEESEEQSFVTSSCIHQYWPNESETRTFREFAVTNTGEKREDEEIIIRTMLMENTALDEPPRQVSIVQFVGWPDHGVPNDVRHIRQLFDIIDSYADNQELPGPVITHCSAGVGRTGTFCTIHIIRLQMLKHLKEHPDSPFPFEVYNTVKKLKGQRIGMVQNKDQYEFCYTMLLKEAEDLGIRMGESPVLTTLSSENEANSIEPPTPKPRDSRTMFTESMFDS